ncbi:MAG: TIGR02147 family protein [Chitinivibrionales bacterium]|nr:TIGR02147 family protein [Chitinivibrionales bacterium]
MINVFEYIEYRKLLKDLYEEHKKSNANFSYRYIGQKVGFKSAGFLTNIIKGKRNISNEIIFKFTELFKFTKKETEYFEMLVLYDQSSQHERKKYYFEKMLQMRKSKVHELTQEQYEYFDKWYNVAIRELINFYPFRGDYIELAKRLVPPITPAEAKRSVELLVKLGLIEENEDHTFQLTNNTITTVPHVPVVAINTFQLATMDLAKEAIDRFAKEKRSISTLTISCSEETFKEIESKLAHFRRDVLDMVGNDAHTVNRVYQFNFQIFPLSQLPESTSP